MPRIMPTSTTTIIIIQMTQMRRMISGKIYNQESSSLQPTVTQTFCELQIEMIFYFQSYFSDSVFPSPPV